MERMKRFFPILSCTVLYCTILYCTILYYTILYHTVLYYTKLYCTGGNDAIHFYPMEGIDRSNDTIRYILYSLVYVFLCLGEREVR